MAICPPKSGFQRNPDIPTYVQSIGMKPPITSDTRLCASIAGIANKLSPRLHNAAYDELELDFVFLAFGVSDVRGAIAGMRALGMRGLVVSMPFKQEVMKYLDEVDPVASKIGAVSTIVNDNGKLKGYNSDWIGAIRALQERINPAGKEVVLIGAGEAARAIAYGLTSVGGHVKIYNRTVKKAQELADEFGLTVGGGLEALGALSEYDVIINATSIGMSPDTNNSVVPSRVLKEGKVAMDIVSFPIRTLLSELADAAGCSVIRGSSMLIHQAMFQFELFTGRKPSFQTMEDVAREAMGSEVKATG